MALGVSAAISSNPALQEDGVPSAYHLSVMGTTVHHSCPPFLPGFFPCSGTAGALELPFLKKKKKILDQF